MSGAPTRSNLRRLCYLVLGAVCGVPIGLADEPASQREQLLEQMRGLARATEVRVIADGSETEANLVANPVFRYDDQPRRFIDATIWAWTDRGRPVAFQKIEAVDYGEPAAPSPLWQYCLVSLSTDPVAVKWSSGREFRAKASGVEFRALDEGPAVAEGSNQRKRQARELVRDFSARILTQRNLQEMRLLTTPLFEYADQETKEFQGAVFGFSTNGTNPDLLVLIEARRETDKLAWQFAPARMTTGAVTLKHKGVKVWECELVETRELPLMTWTFFTMPRTPLQAREKP